MNRLDRITLGATILVAIIVVTLVAVSAHSAEDRSRELDRYMEAVPFCESGPDASGEPLEARRARLGVIRGAALEAARSGGKRPWRTVRARAYALLVLTWFESGAWDPRIHAGLPHPTWPQDNGRATCLGQIHPSKLFPPDRWSRLAGTDPEATRRCLGATMALLDFFVSHCRVGYDEDGLARAYAAYATGGRCEPYGESRRRAHRWAVAVATGRP